MNTFIVTGGAGFIGSNLTRLLHKNTDARLIVVDKLTYAGNRVSLKDLSGPRFEFVEADIADSNAVRNLLKEYQPSAIFNLAAETHVDRSIDGPHAFVNTNLMGTFVLLEETRKYLADLPADIQKKFRFVHVSTDEVYGSLGKSGKFTEKTPYDPKSPYSASKAGADHLVMAYNATYGLPAIITNCSNNFGPYQFPEKLVPLMILNALEGKDLPVYGDGGNVRDWLYVEDHCEAIWAAYKKGKPGEKYNIGASNERTNIQMVDRLCAVLEKKAPAKDNPALRGKNVKNYKDLKKFVKDRPGHDRRYAIDASKFKKTTGWKPKCGFDESLGKTVQWYIDNKEWCESVQSGKYRRERLGLSV
jgi:dTDP-glucose 4,6-dehydratase